MFMYLVTRDGFWSMAFRFKARDEPLQMHWTMKSGHFEANVAESS